MSGATIVANAAAAHTVAKSLPFCGFEFPCGHHAQSADNTCRHHGHCVHKQTEPLTCVCCGHTGRDVVIESVHVGGKGYVRQAACLDNRECWKRIDAGAREKE